MKYISTQKFIVNSPRKLREVAAMIKKLKPMEAVERLPFVGKVAAEPLSKVIKSAIANAKQKNVSPEDLVFAEIQIGEGPRLKRFRAGSRGRAKPYKRRISHIRVVLDVTEAKSQTAREQKGAKNEAVSSKSKKTESVDKKLKTKK